MLQPQAPPDCVSAKCNLMGWCYARREEREDLLRADRNTGQQYPRRNHLTLCLPLVRRNTPHNKDAPDHPPLSFRSRVPRTLRRVYRRARFSNGLPPKKSPRYGGMVVNNSVFCASPYYPEEQGRHREMESLDGNDERAGEGIKENGKVCNFAELMEREEEEEEEDERMRESTISSSVFVMSEATGDEVDQRSQSSSENSFSPLPSSWSLQKGQVPDCVSDNGLNSADMKVHLEDNGKLEKQGSAASEIEMIKERFAKLLLGEDMSGSGNGVSTALAISNAITNLCATIFGQLWRLEPIPPEKKAMWRREMEWLLCVSDHIVELTPTSQTFADGSKIEIMTCRPRPDLYVNLPALRKLDNMLLEILDGFVETEFWYVDQGILALETDGSSSFRQALQRQEEKWWLPVPRVPSGGLSEKFWKHLKHKRDCTNQILKAAMAINGNALAEMGVPESYLESLPKNGRACLGDVIYRYILSDQFSPECLLDCLDLTSEHQAIEIANRIESSIYLWRKRINSKPVNKSNSRSSWGLVKELMVDAEKWEFLADRAETLLLCLKQWFPGLPQTNLDMSKIQCNKDVGESILESYSRVLESLAFNIVARIDDILYVDDLTKHSDTPPQLSKVGLIAHKSVSLPYALSISGTPYKSALSTPNFSPARLFSPMTGERSPFIASRKLQRRGVEVKKVLTDYIAIDAKGKACGKSDEDSHSSLTSSPAENFHTTE